MNTEQVDFYLLKAQDKVAALALACRIANKAYSQGMTVYLQTNSLVECETLDRHLWTFSDESYLPHGIETDDSNWQKYPVQIGCRDSMRDQIDLLISLSDEVPTNAFSYKRIADVIVDSPEQKQRGRVRFKHYRDKGIEPNTHSL